MNGKVYKVDELSKVINSAIATLFQGSVAVVGEVLNRSVSPAGHLYFSIKDTSSTINVVMFKNYAQLNNITVKNGDLVVVHGELNTYPASSTYQLRARRVVYERIGDFYKRFEEVRRLLEREGLFDSQKKQQLNKYPKHIALITSSHGAALGDFIKVANSAGAIFKVDLYNVPVQGQGAEQLITSGIQRAAKSLEQRGYNYDAIVVMRGGGSQDDLAVFNSESIARAIHACHTPVVSAIGHERDQTICDLVADVVASTPTDAATLLATEYSNARNKSLEIEQTITHIITRRLEDKWQNLDHTYAMLLQMVSSHQINSYRAELEMLLTKVYSSIDYGFTRNIDAYEKQLKLALNTTIAKHKNQLNHHAQIVRSHQPQLQNHTQILNYMGVNLKRNIINRTQTLQHKLNNISRRCSPTLITKTCQISRGNIDEQTMKLTRYMDNILYNHKRTISRDTQLIINNNPELLLQKGYSIVYHEGNIVENLTTIEPHSIVNIQLKTGWLKAEVLSATDEKEE